MASKSKTKAKTKKPNQAVKKGKTAKAAKPKTVGKPKAQKTAQKPKADKLSPKNVSKTLSIMAALKSENGITIDEMIKLTGWLPHTARAHLSVLRKKLLENKEGLQIAKYTRDGKTMYKLEDAA